MIDFSVTEFATVDSTNRVVRDAIAQGASEGFVARADVQTGGYGRRGHTWESPAGGMYASMLLRPAVDGVRLVTLPLLVGLSTREACQAMSGGRFGLKWPNDVFALDGEGKPSGKVAGVVMEAVGDAVVVGVGIDAHLLPGAPMPQAVLKALLDAFGPRYERWIGEGLAPFLAQVNTVNILTGRTVRVEVTTGALLEGTVESIEADGRLALRDPRGQLIQVSSGDAHILL